MTPQSLVEVILYVTLSGELGVGVCSRLAIYDNHHYMNGRSSLPTCACSFWSVGYLGLFRQFTLEKDISSVSAVSPSSSTSD